MSDYIPLEILGEIIKRLPVKLLVQYRSVSKSWKCLIDSSDFIAGYGARQTQPRRLLVWHAEENLRGERYVSLVDDETFVKQEINPTVPVLSKLLTMASVVGSSHGLLCLYGNYSYHKRRSINVVAVLWNPSIRKSVCIPVPGVFDVESDHISLGFGVCPIISDPTIVMIDRSRIGSQKSWVVEVFTLSTGRWRILSGNLPNNSIRVMTWPQVVIDRFIYWLASEIMGAMNGSSIEKSLIMSYDMTTQGFRRVDIPDNLARRSSNLSISKVSEALAVLVNNQRGTGGWDVWIMDDGVPNSFTKLVSISAQDGFLRTLGGFTLSATASKFVYEPCSQYINDIRIIGYGPAFYVGFYMESLLLLDQSDCSVYFKNSVVPMDSPLWINSLLRPPPPRRSCMITLLEKLSNIF